MEKIINHKRYNTKTATRICFGGYFNIGRCTKFTELYKTTKGAFFFYHRTICEFGGESDTITPCGEPEAVLFYAEQAIVCDVKFGAAFPSRRDMRSKKQTIKNMNTVLNINDLGKGVRDFAAALKTLKTLNKKAKEEK
jgi:hypothetical protein